MNRSGRHCRGCGRGCSGRDCGSRGSAPNGGDKTGDESRVVDVRPSLLGAAVTNEKPAAFAKAKRTEEGNSRIEEHVQA